MLLIRGDSRPLILSKNHSTGESARMVNNEQKLDDLPIHASRETHTSNELRVTKVTSYESHIIWC